MGISMRLILLVLAFVAFALQAMNITAPRINLNGLGLALMVLAQLVT